MEETEEIPEIATIKQGPEILPFMTESAIAWKIFRDDEFRRRCSRKVGRRRYILPREIIRFVKEQNEKNGGCNE